VRFFFMREMQVGLDRSFSYEGFMDRLNADLANGLGNLASRTLSMLQRYRSGAVPDGAVLDEEDRKALEAGRAVVPAYLAKAGGNDFQGALDLLWTYLRQLDGYIVKAEPWKLAKDPAAADKLDAVLCQLYRALRATALLVAPVMPELAQKLWQGLGQAGQVADQRFEAFRYDAPAPGPVGEPAPLFQRIDKESIMQQDTPPAAEAAPEAAPTFPPLKDLIEIDTFVLMDLRVGRVLTAERVPKSKKLIKMTVDVGFEVRTILGGIGTAYEPEQLVDRKVVVVANLAPRPMMGSVSHGMLLCASDNDSKPYLIAPPEDAKPGYVVR
jgi:methionyl-tRNA synthetase